MLPTRREGLAGANSPEILCAWQPSADGGLRCECGVWRVGQAFG